MKKKSNQKGFTLVELLVVITIMGILGSVLVTNYTKYVDKSKQVVVDEQLNEIIQVFELSFIDGIKYNDKTYLSYQEMFEQKVDMKLLYESLSGASLPSNSTLEIDSEKITYALNGKTSLYNFS